MEMQHEICKHLTYLGYEIGSRKNPDSGDKFFFALKKDKTEFGFYIINNVAVFHHGIKEIHIKDRNLQDFLTFLNMLNTQSSFSRYLYIENFIEIKAFYFGTYETKAFLDFIELFNRDVKMFYDESRGLDASIFC